MSELNLIDVVNLIRAEIARTEIGDVKRITGPAGERGSQGEQGIQGPQGPRGNDGKQGPAGIKGNQGKKGDKGVKGADGADGVGIARVEQDIDNAIIVYLTDGNYYTIEMPLVQDDGSLAKEVHFKSGGGGSGVVDLSGYVKRPSNTHGGKWLLYREADGTNQGEWAPATTDLIETNGQLMFRDINGRFAPTPEELDELDNQLKVNRFIWERIQELDAKAAGVAISTDPPNDPENGMFWFDNSEDVMQLFIWHKDSDAWIPVAPPTTLEGRVSAGEATQAAIIAQIQTSLVEQETLKNKVSALEGAVGDHSFIFEDVAQNPREGQFILKNQGNLNTNMLSEEGGIISFSETDRDGHSVAWDKVSTGDVLRMSSIDGQIAELKVTAKAAASAFIYEKISGDLERLSLLPYDFLLLSSFDPAGLATIDYVDDQDALLQAANKEYVDDEIGKIVIPEAAEALQPLLWKYMGQSVEPGDLKPGQWTYRKTGSEGNANDWFWIFTSRYDSTGRQISSNSTFQHDMTDKMFFSIQNEDGGIAYHMKSKVVYFNTGSGDKKYHRYEAKFWRVARTLAVGKHYIINVPGLLPTYGRPSNIASFSIPDEPIDGEIPPEADA